MGVFAGGIGNPQTRALAKRLGGENSRRFYGIVIGDKDVLYRHGQYRYTVSPSNQERYFRWFWLKATEEDLKKTDFLLLHATKPDETFFLIPTKKAKPILDEFSGRTISVAVEPGGSIRKRRDAREMLEPFRITFSNLKKLLAE